MVAFYRLLLDDYSTPSFVSFDKSYYGTEEQFASFFQALKEDEQTAKRQEYLLSVYDQYAAGNKSVCHNVAYHDVPFLVPAKLLRTKQTTLVNHSWEHTNTWGHPYYMKCDKADCTHVLLSCEGKYARCILVEFENLVYQSPIRGWVPPGSAWGFPHQLELNTTGAFTRLYVEEKLFDSKTDAFKDWEAFNQSPDPVFKRVLDDLFGDG